VAELNNSESISRRCRTCAIEKPIHEYGINRNVVGGRERHCKACVNAKKILHSRAYRARNLEKVRARGREVARRYRAAGGKKKGRTPQTRARGRLNAAIKKGLVVKPAKCGVCGAGGVIHGHHLDYAKPFDVLWLCSGCHGIAHRKQLAD
jgi:hypothetical protein